MLLLGFNTQHWSCRMLDWTSLKKTQREVIRGPYGFNMLLANMCIVYIYDYKAAERKGEETSSLPGDCNSCLTTHKARLSMFYVFCRHECDPSPTNQTARFLFLSPTNNSCGQDCKTCRSCCESETFVTSVKESFTFFHLSCRFFKESLWHFSQWNIFEQPQISYLLMRSRCSTINTATNIQQLEFNGPGNDGSVFPPMKSLSACFECK